MWPLVRIVSSRRFYQEVKHRIWSRNNGVSIDWSLFYAHYLELWREGLDKNITFHDGSQKQNKLSSTTVLSKACFCHVCIQWKGKFYSVVLLSNANFLISQPISMLLPCLKSYLPNDLYMGIGWVRKIHKIVNIISVRIDNLKLCIWLCQHNRKTKVKCSY